MPLYMHNSRHSIVKMCIESICTYVTLTLLIELELESSIYVQCIHSHYSSIKSIYNNYTLGSMQAYLWRLSMKLLKFTVYCEHCIGTHNVTVYVCTQLCTLPKYMFADLALLQFHIR